MPDSRSRSPPPRREDRQRSRSPRRRREEDRPRRGGGGFKWKEKRREDDGRNRDDDRRLERGYRDRGRHDRPRSPIPEQNDKVSASDVSVEKPKKEKKEKKSSAPAPTSEPMIIVNVNDRLGTKASIPCLASDPISKLVSSPYLRYKLTRCRAFQSPSCSAYRT